VINIHIRTDVYIRELDVSDCTVFDRLGIGNVRGVKCISLSDLLGKRLPI
jgi:hypothetical protein